MRVLAVIVLGVALTDFSQARSVSHTLLRGVRSADETTDTTSAAPSANTAGVNDEPSQTPMTVTTTAPPTEKPSDASATLVSSTETSTSAGAPVDAMLRADTAQEDIAASKPVEQATLVEAVMPADLSESTVMPVMSNAEVESKIKEAMMPILETMEIVEKVLPAAPAPVAMPSAPVEAGTVNATPQNEDATENKIVMPTIHSETSGIPKAALVVDPSKVDAEADFDKQVVEPSASASMLEAVLLPVDGENVPASVPLSVTGSDDRSLAPEISEPPVQASMPEPVLAPFESQAVQSSQVELSPVASSAEETRLQDTVTDTFVVPAQAIHIDGTTIAPAMPLPEETATEEEKKTENQVDDTASSGGRNEDVPDTPDTETSQTTDGSTNNPATLSTETNPSTAGADAVTTAAVAQTSELPASSSRVSEPSTSSSEVSEPSTSSSGVSEPSTSSGGDSKPSTLLSGVSEASTSSSGVNEASTSTSGVSEASTPSSGVSEASTPSSGVSEASTSSSGVNEPSTSSSGVSEPSTSSSGVSEASTSSSGVSDVSSTEAAATSPAPDASSSTTGAAEAA